MTPTSAAFLWTVRVLFAVAVLWTVVRWGKAAAPTVWGVLKRLVTIAVLVVLGTLNVLLPVNAQWGWYTTWADVASLISPPPMVAPGPVSGGSPAAAAAAKVGPFPLAGLPTAGRDRIQLHLHDPNVGGSQVFTVPGPGSGYTGQVTVWFPPSYTDRAVPRHTYPVIEAFHGFLPSPLGFFKVYKLDSDIEQLASQHRMAESVVVVPHWAPGKVDTECVDGGPGRIRMETWLTQDVPRWVYENLRVESGRQSWAALGASAGGWCALMASFLHPTQYSAAVSMAGYTYPDFDPPYIPFPPASALGRHYDLPVLVRRRPPAVAVWALTSTADKLTDRPTTGLAAEARSPLSVTPTVLPGGGHRAELWTPYFPEALGWLARSARGFAPR